MADNDHHHSRLVSRTPRVTRDEIASQNFPQSFRGLSEPAVRSYLRRIADEFEALRVRNEDLVIEIEQLEARLGGDAPKPHDDDLLNAVGEETARVLRSAKESADEIRRNAERRADEILDQAQDDARRVRDEAETVAGERAHEADESAAEMLREAERLARELREGAEARAAEYEARAQADAAAEIDSARRRAREMMAETQAARDRILHELSRRKEALEAQIDVLRTGRERLIEAYRVVKRTLDEASESLRNADVRPPEATVSPAVPLTPPEDEAGVVEVPGDEEGQATEVHAVGEPDADVEGVEASGGELDEQADEAEPEAEIAGDEGEEPERHVGSFTLGELPDDDEGGEAAEETPGISGPAQPVDTSERREPSPIRLLGAEQAPEYTEGEAEAGPEPTEAAGVETDEHARADEATHEQDPEAIDELEHGERPERGEVEAIFARLRAANEADDTEAPTDDEAHPPPPKTPADALLARRDEVLEQHADELVRVVKRVVRDEQNLVLEAARRHRRGVPEADEIVPSPDEQSAAFADAAGSILEAACAAGAAYARDVGVVDANGDGGGDPARTRELAVTLAHELMEPLRGKLADTLREAAAMEDTNVEERVRRRYREWKGRRVDAAARNALGAAFVRGLYDAVPDGVELRWVAGESAPCPDCADNTLEAASRGSTFPTGHRHPPAHPGCACAVVPVEITVTAGD